MATEAALSCDALPSDQTIATAFARQLACAPEAIAIDADGDCWSYNELDQYSTRIAHALSAAPSGNVALYFPQGALAISAILGAAKAGRPYVPIDPGDPGARTAYAVRDSEAVVILTAAEHCEGARALATGEVSVLAIDELPDRAAADAAMAGGPSDASPDDLAYIIYTSGSTGEPKGVMQTHRNLLHFVGSYAAGLYICPLDRLSFFYSLSFSAALMDIFGALLHGATLCPYDLKRRGTVELSTWMRQQEITVFHSVPSVFRHFAGQLAASEVCTSVRAIDLGGEPVYGSDVQLFRQHFREECLLVNHLACTEASVIGQYPVVSGREYDGVVPVGRAARGVRVRLIADDGTEIAAGDGGGANGAASAVGEIIVESRHVSPGYWRKEELSARQFSDLDNGVRAYHSGDLGRFDADGYLEHMGRNDDRVKIHGHTIEIAEVEAALLALPDVAEGVVVARDGGAGTQIVGHVVLRTPAAGDGVAAARLVQQQLRDRLPEAMVPAQIRIATELPRGATGKVDRRALPDVDAVQLEYEAPATIQEQHVVDLWRDALGADTLGSHRIGRHDHFFDLGGTSLQAIDLVSVLERKYHTKFASNTLMQHPTVAQLGALLADLKKVRPQGRMWSVRPSGSLTPLFCVYGAWSTMSQYLDPERPIYGLEPPGFNLRRVPRTLADAAAEYLAEVRAVQPDGPYVIAGYSAGAVFATEMVQQLCSAGEEVAQLVLVDPLPMGITVRYGKPAWMDGTLGRRLRRAVMRHRCLRLPLAELSLRLIGRVPHMVRACYSNDAFHKQLKKYRPLVHDIPTAILHTSEYEDPTRGWDTYLENITGTYSIDGTHHVILDEPHARSVAVALEQALLPI